VGHWVGRSVGALRCVGRAPGQHAGSGVGTPAGQRLGSGVGAPGGQQIWVGIGIGGQLGSGVGQFAGHGSGVGTLDGQQKRPAGVNSAARAGVVKTIGGIGSASWSCTITGLVEGENSFTVTARDFVFNASTLTGVLTLDTLAPALTLDAVASPARGAAKTLTGTVEAGIVPQVQIGSAAEAGPVTVSGTSWSCPLSGLLPGANDITVTALDPAGNLSSVQTALQIVVPDGNFKGTGVAEISDALLALRIAVGLREPSPLEFLHGNVAPLANGVPDPDDKIDIADALAILSKVVGLLSF